MHLKADCQVENFQLDYYVKKDRISTPFWNSVESWCPSLTLDIAKRKIGVNFSKSAYFSHQHLENVYYQANGSYVYVE